MQQFHPMIEDARPPGLETIGPITFGDPPDDRDPQADPHHDDRFDYNGRKIDGKTFTGTSGYIPPPGKNS